MRLVKQTEVKRTEEMAHLRPWRKLKLQVHVTDKWNDIGQEGQEDHPDAALPQVGGHGAWDKDQSMQVTMHTLYMYLF